MVASLMHVHVHPNTVHLIFPQRPMVSEGAWRPDKLVLFSAITVGTCDGKACPTSPAILRRCLREAS